MQIAITIIVLLIVGAIVGSALNFAGLFLGIPFVLLFIGAVVTKELLDRQRRIMQMKRYRNSARASKVQFSDEDKRTMVS
jgi:Sec-independent protein secretion pathway component TatC